MGKKKQKPCLICGKLTDGYIQMEWEEVKDEFKKEQLFINNPDKPMNDLDIVGYPICKRCYKIEFEK